MNHSFRKSFIYNYSSQGFKSQLKTNLFVSFEVGTIGLAVSRYYGNSHLVCTEIQCP